MGDHACGDEKTGFACCNQAHAGRLLGQRKSSEKPEESELSFWLYRFDFSRMRFPHPGWRQSRRAQKQLMMKKSNSGMQQGIPGTSFPQ